MEFLNNILIEQKAQVIEEIKSRTAEFRNLVEYEHTEEEITLQEAITGKFGCYEEAVNNLAELLTGKKIKKLKSYPFVGGVAVVPLQLTNREDFDEGEEGDEAYAEAEKAEQAATSFKLGNAALIVNTKGDAIFSTTGNIGSSLPKKLGSLRAASDDEIEELINSLIDNNIKCNLAKIFM